MINLSNVINITVETAPVGLGAYNVNNVALITSDDFLSNPDSDVWRAYASAAAVGVDFGTSTETYQQAVAFFSQNPSAINGGGNLIIAPIKSPDVTFMDTLARIKDLVFFVGVITTTPGTNTSWKGYADTIQGYGDKILLLGSNASGDIAGAFTDILNAKDTNTRCLFYSVSALDARLFAAAYAGRGFSTDFAGSNTVETMNLKQLATIDPDEGVTQTIYNQCATAGVDCYADIASFAGVISNGANKYFDEVYCLIWLVSALKVAGFNALAQTGTKVPQTEAGVSVLKSAYRSVCNQAVVNGFAAPGAWTLPSEVFGNQQDFYYNIAQLGFYLYSQPVNQQSSSDRAARKAPLIQIALKESGAIQESDVVVFVNA